MTMWASLHASRHCTTAATSATLFDRVEPVRDTVSLNCKSDTHANPAVHVSLPLSSAGPSVHMCMSQLYTIVSLSLGDGPGAGV